MHYVHMQKLLIHLSIFFQTDIDEYSDGTHNCSQICTNTNGSFICGCNNGFLLDEITCNSMHKKKIISICDRLCENQALVTKFQN